MPHAAWRQPTRAQSCTAAAAKDRNLILVDTSVWVDHLRSSDALLADRLELSDVVMHPFVVSEIACGSLTDRALILELLQQLPAAVVAEPDEVLGYVKRHKLYGTGIGYVDVHLLASAAIGATKLWTRDRKLQEVAQELGCAFSEASSL